MIMDDGIPANHLFVQVGYMSCVTRSMGVTCEEQRMPTTLS